jgi:hypothetical protein
MNVTIDTDGGFTGRGLGSVSVDSDTVDDRRLRRAVEHARPEAWRGDYRAHGADLVNYTLTLGTHRVSWNTGADIPPDLAELFEAAWAHK